MKEHEHATKNKLDARPAPDEVAKAAYAIHLKEGRPQGRDVQNWLEAEGKMPHAKPGCIEGITGWAIDGVAQGKETENRTSLEAQSLYQKLGQVVLPAFYQQRDDWLRIMRHAIALNASHFNTQWMVNSPLKK
jgi:hypothetical protein